MSKWTRVQTKALEENVDMKIFEEAIKDLDLTLDYSQTTIENAYGRGKVNAMLKHKGNITALGIIITEKKGIELSGDTWGSGIVGDNNHNSLVEMLGQAYHAHRIKRDLIAQGWVVTTKKVKDEIKLTCIEY